MTSNELQTMFEKFYDDFHKFAYKIVGDQAYDVVMEVFTYVLEHPEVIDRNKYPKTYFYVSIKNKCVDLIRRRKVIDDRFDIPTDDLLDDTMQERIAHRVEDMEQKQEVMEVIKSLAPQQRRILELSIIDQISRKEIAEIMGISENTVRNQKAAA